MVHKIGKAPLRLICCVIVLARIHLHANNIVPLVHVRLSIVYNNIQNTYKAQYTAHIKRIWVRVQAVAQFSMEAFQIQGVSFNI